MKRRSITAHSACIHIVSHARQFGNRYGQDHKTLYDRFRRARRNTASRDSPSGGVHH
jgi:hypothetical protein